MPPIQSQPQQAFWLVTNPMRYKRVHVEETPIRSIQEAMGEVDYTLPSQFWSAERVYCYIEADGRAAPKRLTTLVRRTPDGFTEAQSVVVSVHPLPQEHLAENRLVQIFAH